MGSTEIQEIWKRVSGFKNYEVSTLGRVRNCRRGNIFTPGIGPNGYRQVGLRRNGIRRNLYVHRIVAQAFVPNPENKPQVDHKDRDVSNNCCSNLRWSTISENNGNRVKTKNRSSIFKGVFFCNQKQKWCAYIVFKRKHIHIGFFDDEKKAGEAYNRKAIEIFGEFANPNNVDATIEHKPTVLLPSTVKLFRQMDHIVIWFQSMSSTGL